MLVLGCVALAFAWLCAGQEASGSQSYGLSAEVDGSDGVDDALYLDKYFGAYTSEGEGDEDHESTNGYYGVSSVAVMQSWREHPRLAPRPWLHSSGQRRSTTAGSMVLTAEPYEASDVQEPSFRPTRNHCRCSRRKSGTKQQRASPLTPTPYPENQPGAGYMDLAAQPTDSPDRLIKPTPNPSPAQRIGEAGYETAAAPQTQVPATPATPTVGPTHTLATAQPTGRHDSSYPSPAPWPHSQNSGSSVSSSTTSESTLAIGSNGAVVGLTVLGAILVVMLGYAIWLERKYAALQRPRVVVADTSAIAGAASFGPRLADEPGPVWTRVTQGQAEAAEVGPGQAQAQAQEGQGQGRGEGKEEETAQEVGRSP